MCGLQYKCVLLKYILQNSPIHLTLLLQSTIFILDFQTTSHTNETKPIYFYYYKNNLGIIKRMLATRIVLPA